jgi:uncharacterized membrane protein
MNKLFKDILRDSNNLKYSMTKFVALNILVLLNIHIIFGIYISIINKTIDHILIVEMIALLLTLLGFKNFRNPKVIENEGINSPPQKIQ